MDDQLTDEYRFYCEWQVDLGEEPMSFQRWLEEAQTEEECSFD